jgi:creatinine amidohydrolase
MSGTGVVRRLGDMSWTDVRDEIAKDPVPIVLVPIGVVEQHGPHLPLNEDSMVAEWVAERISERTGALVAPVLNYGYSPTFRGYPGTINLRSETLTAITYDILSELARHGLRRIVLVNNNGGNVGPCMAAAYEVRRDYGIVVGQVYPWSLGYAMMRDQYADPDKVYGHGGEPEHSAMKVMFPELVQPVSDETIAAAGFKSYGDWKAGGYQGAVVPGQSVQGTMFWDTSEVNPTGASGDLTVASKEIGEVWVERIVGFGAAFVEEFDKQTAKAPWAKAPGKLSAIG